MSSVTNQQQPTPHPGQPGAENHSFQSLLSAPSWSLYAAVTLVLAAAYFGLGRLALFASYHEGIGSPVWLPTGFALGALLLWGGRYWPMILLGNIATVLVATPGNTPDADAIIKAFMVGTGNSLEAVLSVLVLRRGFKFDSNMNRVRDAILLSVFGAILLPIVSVLFWQLSLVVTGKFDSSTLLAGSLVWWAGNLTGCMLIAPLMLAWFGLPRPRWSRDTALKIIEAAALTGFIILVCELCFGNLLNVDAARFPFAFLMFPPIVLAAIRFDSRGVTSAVAACAYITVRGTLDGAGPFVQRGESDSENVAALSIFLFTLSITGLILNCALREREAAARDRIEVESKYHQLIEQASDGIFVTDTSGTYIEANRAGLEMLGYTLDELRRKTMRELMSVDDASARPTPITDLHTGAHVIAERRLRRKDGSTIPIEASAKKLRDGRFIAIVRDITQRRRDEAQRALMMRELDHRVKNNLAVVLSIADQTARSSDTIAEFSERFIGRIMSLARVHGLLAKSKWTGADLESVVSKTLGPHGDNVASEGRIRLSGPRCQIPSRAVGPLCMTLHELATNAAKYGALSVPHGVVEIRWDVHADDTLDKRVQLSWREQGGPAVAEPESRGFGTQLIEAGLPHELGAKVNLEFKPDGVRCEMMFSLREEPTTAIKES